MSRDDAVERLAQQRTLGVAIDHRRIEPAGMSERAGHHA